MSNLEQTWRAWRALSRPDRCKFLALLRGVYAEERAAVLRKNGCGARGATASSLGELVLTETDLQR